MDPGGHSTSGQRPSERVRILRVAAIAGLIFTGIATGIGNIGTAGAVDESKHAQKAKKAQPASMGKPTVPAMKQQRLPAVQKQLPANPTGVQKLLPKQNPVSGNTNAVTSNVPASKALPGKGQNPTGSIPKETRTTSNQQGKGLTSNQQGKGLPAQQGTGRGADGKASNLQAGKGGPGQVGRTPNLQTAALGKNGRSALPPGAGNRPGFGKSAQSMNPIERRRLVIGHRTEIFAARLRLPPHPMPGQQGFTGVPPRGETRYVQNELVLHVGPNVSPQALNAAMQRHGLTTVSSQSAELTGGTMLHLRYTDRRAMTEVVHALELDNIGIAQPDYVYTFQQDSSTAGTAGGTPGEIDQYVVAKLGLEEAHHIATGKNVLIAVIDSQIDEKHPDLAGAITDRFDPLNRRDPPDTHGTGMAGAIAAHRALMGVAPGVRILTARAFSPDSGKSPQATTRNIIAGLDWAIKKGARVINMSFAGPYDPMLQLAMKNAHDKGVVLIAASGNLGPKSPPLYPAADPHVIAVTATDENDQLFAQAVRGPHVAVAAPGVDVVVPAPNSDYQFTTGTSVATAHVSGVAAMLIERYPSVDAETILEVLTSSAKRLNPKGRDDQFGWGLIDPSNALAELDARMSGAQVAGSGKPSPASPAALKPAQSRPPGARPASISAH
jgi:subtilisin family serine protease